MSVGCMTATVGSGTISVLPIRKNASPGAEQDDGASFARITDRLLEDASEASAHAADVIRVTSGIDLHPFTAAPREADLKDSGSAQSKCGADADAGFQSLEAEVARFPAHLAKLCEYAYPEGVHDLALVADLVRNEIGVSEAIVAIAPQQVLIVDVGAAQCRLQIEGHPVPRVRVAEDESAGEVDGSEALLSIQTDADVPSRIEPS